jgi:hypothetical protein
MWFRHRSITLELYIGDNSILHIDSGSFNFGSHNNNQQDYIKLRSIIYGDGASWIGASTKRFVDGYVQTRSTTAFVLPVGHSVFMRQQVTPSTSKELMLLILDLHQTQLAVF